MGKSKFICTYCGKDCKNLGGLNCHVPYCKLNKNRVPRPRSPLARSRKGCIPWNKGLTMATSKIVKRGRDKRVKLYREGIIVGSFTGRHHTAKTKRKMSKICKQRHLDGWDNKAGRCKKYKYKSKYAGLVTLDGTWELAVAQYLDKNDIPWKRPNKRFPYRFRGKSRTYKPDFYLTKRRTYIEVNQTLMDRAKWRDFPYRLQVWKADKLIKLGIL